MAAVEDGDGLGQLRGRRRRRRAVRVVRGRLPPDVATVVDGEEGVLLPAARLELHPELELDVFRGRRSLLRAVQQRLLVVLDERLDGLDDLPLVDVTGGADELGVDGLVVVAALRRREHALNHVRALLRRRRPDQEVTVIDEGLLTVVCIRRWNVVVLLDRLWRPVAAEEEASTGLDVRNLPVVASLVSVVVVVVVVWLLLLDEVPPVNVVVV